MSGHRLTLFLVILGILLAGGVTFFAWRKFFPKEAQVFCTQDAKQCPDGSYVGRTGPQCEFAPCPTPRSNGWKTFTDTQQGISFQYPEKLSTTYITALDWPPKIQLADGPFACNEAGSETMPAGKTESRTVSNHTYCRTTELEGAAGSIYAQYAYVFSIGDKVAIFTFRTRSVQCENYDDPQKTECLNERSSFDLDSVIDRMAQTVTVH